MNETDIVQKGDPVLRKKAQPVDDEAIDSPKIKKIISNMKAALADTDDGVAIAAPQIGEPVRIFVVRDMAFEDRGDVPNEDKAFINPELVNTSKSTHTIDEGCLSVRHVYGKVERSEKATVRAQDESGKTFEMGASGLLAQIFQHEIEHLDGKLFVDKANDLRQIDPDTRRRTEE